jgi:hypothetical protein
LPENLKIMHASFTRIVDLEELKIPSNISVLPSNFATNSEIKKIIIGTHVTSINDDLEPFKWANTTIYGYAGSFAEELAHKYNIPFVNIGSDYKAYIDEQIGLALEGDY